VVGTELAKDLHLVALEADIEVGAVALVVEAEAGVVGAQMVGAGESPGGARWRGDLDLAPRGVLMPPEVSPPTPVELFESAVLSADPILEVGAAGVAEADRMAELIVGLPADNVWRVGEMGGHGPGDPLAEQPVCAGGEAVVLADTPGDALAGRQHGQRLRILAGHPGGHDGSGGAEQGRDVVVVKNGEGVVEPVELETPLHRLHVDPGELCEADDVESRLLHELRVNFPAFSGPVLGVVVGAYVHHLSPGVSSPRAHTA